MDSALFLNPNKLWLTLQNSTFFGPSFPPHPQSVLLNFNTWYGVLHWRPPTSSPNCHFWGSFFVFDFEFFTFFSATFFPELDKIRTVGIKRWKNRIFQKAVFLFSFFFSFFTSYHLIESFFNYFFLCSIAKILAELQEFGTLEAPLWLHFPILAKMHFFMF